MFQKMREMFTYPETISSVKHFPGIKTELVPETELVQGIFPVMGKTGPDRGMLNDYIVKDCEGLKCTVCGKRSASKQTLLNHVESVHFPNTFTYTCKFCGKEYNAKNTLQVHISTKHKSDK